MSAACLLRSFLFAVVWRTLLCRSGPPGISLGTTRIKRGAISCIPGGEGSIPRDSGDIARSGSPCARPREADQEGRTEADTCCFKVLVWCGADIDRTALRPRSSSSPHLRWVWGEFCPAKKFFRYPTCSWVLGRSSSTTLSRSIRFAEGRTCA